MKKLIVLALAILLVLTAFAAEQGIAQELAGGFSKAKTLLIGDVDVPASIQNKLTAAGLIPVSYSNAQEMAKAERIKAEELLARINELSKTQVAPGEGTKSKRSLVDNIMVGRT